MDMFWWVLDKAMSGIAISGIVAVGALLLFLMSHSSNQSLTRVLSCKLDAQGYVICSDKSPRKP